MNDKGVPRVVWERQRQRLRVNANPEQDKQTDRIPLLNISRSLGDFWSYNPRTQKFTVSPCPDVSVEPLNLNEQKFVVIASDGLWNVMTPNEVVSFIWDYEHDLLCNQESKDVVRALINEALRRWKSKGLLADNIAVLIAFLSDQPPAATQDISTSNSRDATPLIMDTTNEETCDGSCGQHATLTPPPPPEQNEAAIIEHTTSSRSGSLYYYKETLPDGRTIEYETKIKLLGKKHKLQDSQQRISGSTGFKKRDDELEKVGEVGGAEKGEYDEGFVWPQLKRGKRMHVVTHASDEGHISDSSSSSSGVYSDGFSPDAVKEPSGLFEVKEAAGSSASG